MPQNSIKKNFIYNVLYQALVIFIPLITSPYLTRVIGAEGLGIYTFTQSYAHYFILFIMLGVSNYGNREIAKARDNKEDASRTFWEIYSFQGLLLVFVSTIYAISVLIFIKNNQLIYWLQLIYVVSAGFDINWCCFGLEKFKLTVIRNSIIKICTAVLVFVLIKSPNDVWIYTLLLSGALLLSQIVVWPFVLRDLGFSKPSKKGVISHIKPNLLLFMPVIAISLYTIMDKLMLGVMNEKAEVAYYTYAGRLVEVPETVVTALTTVMLPRTANMLYTGKTKESATLLNKSMQFAMMFSIGSAFGLASIAYDFIPWYYGSSFSRCALIAIWLSPVIILTSWNGIIRNQFVIPKGYDKVYLITVSAGAVMNLIMNLILIPIFNGVGAAIGTVIAQATVCIMQYFLTRKEIDFKTFLPDMLVFILIGLLMSGVLAMISNIKISAISSILLKTLIGVVLYGSFVFIYLVKYKKDRIIFDSVVRFIPFLNRSKR